MIDPITRRALIGTSAAAVSLVPLVTSGRAVAAPMAPDVGPEGRVVKVSALGHDILDSTDHLQAALDSDAETVVIDHVPGGWTTRPLFLRRSNVTIVVEPDVMVRSLTGGFAGGSDSLLTILNQDNVHIRGYGAVFAMNKPEYKSGEGRMAIKLYGCSNVTIEGLTLRDSGGDGVYVGSSSRGPCKDIVLRDLVSDNHRRQGLSVISVENLLVEGCAFLNTVGTAPQSGIDFEPNKPNERIVNATVRDCVFHGNMTAGIQLYGGQLLPTSHPVSIVVERSSIGHQIGGSPHIMISAKKDTPFPGTFEVRDCLIDTATGSGALGVFRTTPTGLRTTVTRTGVWSWGNAFLFYPPILVQSGGETAFGNLSLADVVIHTDQPGPCLATDKVPDTTVHGVAGNLAVFGPAAEPPDIGATPVDSDLRTTVVVEDTVPTVSVRSAGSAVRGGEPGEFVFSRSGDVDRPLAVAFTTSGSARERYDYGGLGKVVVIPKGAREARVGVRTFAQRRLADPARRELLVSVAQGRGYSPQPMSARIQIQD